MSETLDAKASAHIEQLIARYRQRTRRSLDVENEQRGQVVKPLAAFALFDPPLKQLLYPLVSKRAHGSRFFDIDDNEYVDLLMGFGVHLLGHNPASVVAAIEEQLHKGMVIGADSEHVSDVARDIAAMTGHDRVYFTNTGTEAVMSAVRVARAATGRDAILVFAGSYHGHFDAVLVRPGEPPRTLPFPPGIPASASADTWVAEYGSDAALELVKQRGSELAAVLVVPIQTGNPTLRPRAFLHELRTLTESSGTALVFDEMVTGFRVHQGGAQAYFGVRADLATYGKIVGGGLPIGVVTGSEAFMRSADSGPFGPDGESPRGRATYLAGTFNKHPLVLAAARATLRYLKEAGPVLQEQLNARSDAFVARLEQAFGGPTGPLRFASCGSLVQFSVRGGERLRALLMYHLIERGVYVRLLGPQGYLMHLSTAHDARDHDAVHAAIGASLDELRAANLLPATPAA